MEMIEDLIEEKKYPIELENQLIEDSLSLEVYFANILVYYLNIGNWIDNRQYYHDGIIFK